MEDRKVLIDNINNVHTTKMGIDRIKKNLKLNINDDEVVKYCIDIVLDKNTCIYKKGKNYYCILDNFLITINSYSYTIITAHILKEGK